MYSRSDQSWDTMEWIIKNASNKKCIKTVAVSEDKNGISVHDLVKNQLQMKNSWKTRGLLSYKFFGFQ